MSYGPGRNLIAVQIYKDGVFWGYGGSIANFSNTIYSSDPLQYTCEIHAAQTATLDDDVCTFKSWYITGTYIPGGIVDGSTSPTQQSVPYEPSTEYLYCGAMYESDKPTKQYVVTTSSNPANGGTTTGAGTYYEGNTATITATPADRFTFVKWKDESGNVVYNQSHSFTVTKNKNWTAYFEKPDPKYTVTTQASPSGYGTTTGDGTYYEGDTVTITATPASQRKFLRWEDEEGNIVSEQTYTFTITKDKRWTAYFGIQSLTVRTHHKAGATSQLETVSCGNEQYPYSDEIEFIHAGPGNNEITFYGEFIWSRAFENPYQIIVYGILTIDGVSGGKIGWTENDGEKFDVYLPSTYNDAVFDVYCLSDICYDLDYSDDVLIHEYREKNIQIQMYYMNRFWYVHEWVDIYDLLYHSGYLYQRPVYLESQNCATRVRVKVPKGEYRYCIQVPTGFINGHPNESSVMIPNDGGWHEYEITLYSSDIGQDYKNPLPDPVSCQEYLYPYVIIRRWVSGILYDGNSEMILYNQSGILYGYSPYVKYDQSS